MKANNNDISSPDSASIFAILIFLQLIITDVDFAKITSLEYLWQLLLTADGLYLLMSIALFSNKDISRRMKLLTQALSILPFHRLLTNAKGVA